MAHVTAIWLAARRLRERPLQTVLLALAFAGAGGLVGASALVGALSHEDSVRLGLASLPPPERAFRVELRVLPYADVAEAEGVNQASASFSDVAEEPRTVRVWNPIAPRDESGIRLVEAPAEVFPEVTIAEGRLPGGCRRLACEAMALGPGFPVGARIPLEDGVSAVVTGRGMLSAKALPDASELGRQALLVRSTRGALASVLAGTAASAFTTAVLRPESIHASDVEAVAERMRRTTVRLERQSPFVQVEAPVAALRSLAERGEIARRRLLLVAGQGAALILAFAAFAAAARRADVSRLEEQMQTLGATRGQTLAARATEALAPSLAGGAASLVGMWIAVEVVAARRDLPGGWKALAFPGSTALAVLALSLAGAAILLVSTAGERRSRYGVGVLEAAGIVALAVVVWQVAATGGLDAERLADADRGGPLLLLVPSLALFASGVLLLRLLPPFFRLAERAARRGPHAVRLALLSTARNPGHAAAATTFLAVALGSALFAVGYRATLDEQARDAAAFEAAASWRVAERGEPSELRQPSVPDVSPLTRFARVSEERPTPVLRLPATVRETEGASGVEVLALPAGRLGAVSGWRSDFSPDERAAIAERLRQEPIRLTGVRLAGRVDAVRLWARNRATTPRLAVLVLMLPGQRFEQLRLGEVGTRWSPATAPVPRGFEGARIVGVHFAATLAGTIDAEESLDVGRVEQLVGGRWSPLPALTTWAPPLERFAARSFAAVRGDERRFARLGHGPGLHLEYYRSSRVFIRPPIDIPRVLPALVSADVARAAVDGRLRLDMPIGEELEVEVVATAKLFPSVTERPTRFVVLDYPTLFATLNADFPGRAPPSEAWFFGRQSPEFGRLLERPPFRLREATSAARLEERMRTDPLSAGARRLLGWTALVASALAVFGLVLAARASLTAERLVLAEYEALGVPPRTLARSLRARIVVLGAFGIAAAILGGALAVSLVAAFVAVTGSAERPLPPIEAVVAWQAGGAAVGLVGAATVVAAGALSRRALRRPAAARLRG